MDRKAYKAQDRAYRAEREKHRANLFYGTVVAPTTTPLRPFQAPDPLIDLPTRRAALLSKLREGHAELARRAAERTEYAALGLDAPSYILTDRSLVEGQESARWLHLRAVRGNFMPLSVLSLHEGTVRVVQAWRAAA